MEHSALAVMTDLTQRLAITSRSDESVRDAEHLMRSAGVRLLFVVDNDGAVIGLVSYRDLIGERALTAAARDGVKRSELALAAVMTPADDVEALDYKAVAKAQVRDVVQLLRERGRQHALVTENSEGSSVRVRGIFSITQIGRQLGIRIEASGLVQSFAEIERLISAD
ncbi:MAG TPA: CBS domain-containing protein [Gammaproteobacteria bacterium]|nr:CBS domain-containing protein [Gammaproteobacteria bacterium]